MVPCVPTVSRLLAVLSVLVLLVGCVGQPEVRPRAPLAPDAEQAARERLTGRWEARLEFPESQHPVTLTFDDYSLQASTDGVDNPAQAWLPTVATEDAIVLVVVHDTHLQQSAVRFETPDRFRLDELYDLVFERVAPALSADSPSIL